MSVMMNNKRMASSSSAAIPLSPDLLTIPDVGPRNFRKLVEKGIAGVAQLKQLYKDSQLQTAQQAIGSIR